jgi:hypothetical protein
MQRKFDWHKKKTPHIKTGVLQLAVAKWVEEEVFRLIKAGDPPSQMHGPL